jgi:hypothetical protein
MGHIALSKKRLQESGGRKDLSTEDNISEYKGTD